MADLEKKEHHGYTELKQKKTIILSLDDCLLKTSIFKEELPRIDGEFIYNKMNIFVCFRPGLMAFLNLLKIHFELILWSSS